MRRTAHPAVAASLLACLLLSTPARAAGPEDLPFALASSLPREVVAALARHADRDKYLLVAPLNPFYLHGDFNGDGKPDTAILVRHKVSGKIGVAILHGAGGVAAVLGAGREFGNGGDDWSWMDAWRVERRKDGRGDALLVMKTESAGGLVSWDGRAYRWRQQGD